MLKQIIRRSGWPLLLVAACSPPGASHPDMVRLLLPQGDVAAGQRAFNDLGCAACHRVLGAPELPAPVAVDPGPELRGRATAGLSRGALATALIAPAHVNVEDHELWTDWDARQRVWLGPGQPLSEPGSERSISRMRDYRSVMSVQQLCDLLAFLQAPAEPESRR